MNIRKTTQPFLDQIAELYAPAARRMGHDLCFVFPNRRSGVFFREYLGRRLDSDDEKARIHVATLNGLIAQTSELTEATRQQALFALYQAYSAYADDIRFEKFLFWGSMLLDDFNDVDTYLADPETLFVNIERWREIKANYLTERQLEIVRRYWGEDVSARNVENFWQHTDKGDPRKRESFKKLWEVLLPIYRRFGEILRDNGLATRGTLMRSVADRMPTESKKMFRRKLYVFIGFDFPTSGELYIFSRLLAEGRADFYWDFNTPVSSDKGSRVTRMMENMKKQFPSRFTLPEPRIDKFPEIRIVGVPSETGQAKIVGEQLAKWAEERKIADTANAIDTAVVIPDEALLVAVSHAVPESIEAMNVTMGVPLRLTPVAGLMGIVTGLQMTSRNRHGGREYFYEPVEHVIGNPLMQSIAPEECRRLSGDIRLNRLYNISGSYIAENYPSLSFIFPDDNVEESIDSAYAYVARLTDTFSHALDDGSHLLELHFMDAYRRQLDALYDAAKRFRITMRDSTFLAILQRITDSTPAEFEGQPLSGLQIMGVLETRSLDFSNLVITSMNERIFPKKAQIRSFIPESLRQAYALPTSDLTESRYAYYFYRMLSRASRVMLTYDSRTSGVSNGDISRLITHMLYFNNGSNITHTTSFFPSPTPACEPIVIPKIPEIVERLEQFRIPLEQGGRALSASALKHYLGCPLQFCLRDVMRLSQDDEINDYMESSTFGTIVHEVAQRLYESASSDGGEAEITKEEIERWISTPQIIGRLTTMAVNRNFNHYPPERINEPLTGENKVLGITIGRIIKAMLEDELNNIAPFSFVKAEKEIVSRWKVDDSLTVNFRQFIDRIDRVGGKLRIVDYKTGKTRVVINKPIEAMFEVGGDGDLLSVFQVLLYCVLYSAHYNDDQPIRPVIYDLNQVRKIGLSPIKYQKEEVGDYHAVAEEFTMRLNELLKEIFNPEIPFRQTECSNSCKFCDFKSYCGRDNDA